MRVPDPETGKYEGKVFLFISRKTFSAGAVTAAAFKSAEMGIIIGEESCGLVRYCSDPVSIILQGSG